MTDHKPCDPADPCSTAFDLASERNTLDGLWAETKDRLDAALTQVARLREALAGVLTDIDALVDQSEGVAGLHLNGDVAPWADLLPGGRYETWLATVADARAALAETADTPAPAPASGGWTKWEGGECPVAEWVVVEVRYRDTRTARLYSPRQFRWRHEQNMFDIVEYRILEARDE